MMHQYIKGTMLRQDDIRLVKLLLIAVRLDMWDDYDSISKIIRSWGKIED